MRRLLMAGILTLGIGHLAFGAVAQELELTDGTNTALIDSGGVLHLTGAAAGTATVNLATGVFTFNGSVGNYSVNVSTGEGSPLLPLGALDLNSVDTAPGPASGPLSVMWSENGITTVFNGWTMTWGGTLSTGAGGNVAYSAFESNTNGFFATTTPIGTIGPQGSGMVGGTKASAVAGVAAPYSLYELITLNGVGATNYSGNAALTPGVPEPASVLLFGCVVLAVATALRRKVNNKA